MRNTINLAIAQMGKRAEKYTTDQIINTFVDVGSLFSLLKCKDHQILYGRRGTGKTHVLNCLSENIKQEGHCAIKIDLRTIGSSGGIYADYELSIAERATRLLVDTLLNIHEQLFIYALENASKFQLTNIDPILDQLATTIAQVRVDGPVTIESFDELTRLKQKEKGIGVSLVPFNLYGGYRSDVGNSQKTIVKRSASGVEKYRVHFPSISKVFEQLIRAYKEAEIWIMIDEWAEIPLDLQPYLGDLLRRCLFPISGLTVKIGAIEHRSNFRILTSSTEYIGIEVGADVSSVNLDEYMVFENDEEESLRFFQTLLFKHINSILGDQEKYKTPEALIEDLFTQTNSFTEFVRAAEGVPRDAINILSLATTKAKSDKLSKKHVRDAARIWYTRDKEKAVGARPEAIRLLRWIIDKVIGERSARAFLLRTDEEIILIDFLYDSRVLHIIKESISGHDTPGIRYNVYSIDYGCYVELIHTARAPKGLFEVEVSEGNEENLSGRTEFVNVPQNDYRAIRRAILDISEFFSHEANESISNPM